MKYKIIFLGLLSGLISGIAVYIIMSATENMLRGTSIVDIMPYANGLVYGLITSIFFAFFIKKISPMFSMLLWSLTGLISYCLGIITTIYLSGWSIEDGLKESNFSFTFFVGGIVGSLILVLGFNFIYSKLNYRLLILIIASAGIVAGLLGALKSEWMLFVIWQTVITGLLSLAIKEEK
jgi:hypothetical protein